MSGVLRERELGKESELRGPLGGSCRRFKYLSLKCGSPPLRPLRVSRRRRQDGPGTGERSLLEPSTSGETGVLDQE